MSLRFHRQYIWNLAHDLERFFKATWPDWLLLAVIGGVAAGKTPPTSTHLFPIADPHDAIYWPEIAYPYITPIFSSVLAGVLSATIPLLVFATAQLWIRSFVDFASAVLGLAYSMVTGTCFQVILKKTIGGLRPHFLAVCQPVVSSPFAGRGFRGVMYTAEQVCTGNDKARIRNALQSFPSGHAEVAFAGLGFLAIYLFARVRIVAWEVDGSDRRERRRAWYMEVVLVVAPVLFATYLSCTLVLGYHHHWYDVFAGAWIGVFVAALGYRMVFMGILDEERNMVPYLDLKESGKETAKERDRIEANRNGDAVMV